MHVYRTTYKGFYSNRQELISDAKQALAVNPQDASDFYWRGMLKFFCVTTREQFLTTT